MSPDKTAITLLTLGGIFLAGLAADVLGRRTRLPRVTLLLLLGVGVGPIGLDLFPAASIAWFPFATKLALVMVAFLLGGELTLDMLHRSGRTLLRVSIAVTCVTALVVTAGLLALGWPAAVAILLGAVSTSTDPAAVSDVVRQAEARGPFTNTLLGVVAIDDAWGIIAMSLGLALVVGMEVPGEATGIALEGAFELGGALLIGAALGVPMSLLTGRIREGEPTQAEALGGVLLCGGAALYFEVSFLLAAMTMGVVVANLARHHQRPFRAIEGIEWPFMVLFFVLSGASIELSDLGSAAGLTAAYVVLRVLGRVVGGSLGPPIGDGPVRGRLGLALLPQAGVAIGMALVASQRLPELGTSILTATVAGTIVFELAGPLLAQLELGRSGESKHI